MSNLLKSLNNRLVPFIANQPMQRPVNVSFEGSTPRMIGNEVTLYPSKNGENFVTYGYNMNAVVYTCIHKIQKMFGKVPFYMVKIKQGEYKNYTESQNLIKMLHDPRAVLEGKRMHKKSIDGIIEDHRVAKFINKPNRNQSGTAYREMLIGYKKITGEGNTWFNRGKNPNGTQATDRRPLEMFVIPKYALNLIGNTIDPWEIVRYEINLGSGQVPTPKENILMWIEACYNFDATTLTHLRGQSPLEAVLLQIQALNEGAEREIKEAVSGGANGLLFRKDAKDLPTDPAKTASIRNQINNAVNGQDVAGTIAWLAGEWGYLPFGKSSVEMQKVQINEKNAEAICNVLGVPPGLLTTNQTYENAPAFFKQLVYGCIAPEAYSLRDAWNNTFPDLFEYDRDKMAVDCDLLALPELAEDLKSQVAAVKDASWLTLDEKRIATGYEPLGTPEAAKIYMPEGLTSLEEMNTGIGGNLDREESLLNS